SVTSTAAGSMAFAALADWNALAVPAPAAGVTPAGGYTQFDLTRAALYQTAGATPPGPNQNIPPTPPPGATNPSTTVHGPRGGRGRRGVRAGLGGEHARPRGRFCRPDADRQHRLRRLRHPHRRDRRPGRVHQDRVRRLPVRLYGCR